jgi:hypothetical protein
MKSVLFASLWGLTLATSAGATVRYTVSGIETANGYASDIQGINDSGWVTGSFAGGGTTQAFLYNGSAVVTLGTMGGTSSAGGTINNQGWVGGGASNGVAGGTRPFIYDGTQLIDLAVLDPTVEGTSVFKLNNSGQAILYGFYIQYGPMGPPSFILENYGYDGASFTTLGLSPTKVTFGLNDSGLLTGTIMLGPFHTEPFIQDGATLTTLGTFGGTYLSVGYAINSAGEATGQTSSEVGPVAYIYDGNNIVNIGSLLSDPAAFEYSVSKAIYLSSGRAINDHGVVVGDSLYDGGGGRAFHAFVYGDDGIADLNDLIDPASGWELTNAYDVNELGQIVGKGLYNGEQRGFILTPLSAAVPEPASWALMIGGFAMAGATLRRCTTRLAFAR